MRYKLISEKELEDKIKERLAYKGGFEHHIEYRVQIPPSTPFSKLEKILMKSLDHRPQWKCYPVGGVDPDITENKFKYHNAIIVKATIKALGEVETLFKLSDMIKQKDASLKYHVFRNNDETIYDNLDEEPVSSFKI